LVKDHKKKDKWGQFPTRLIISAISFDSAFPKLGYFGIKKIFDDANIDYMKKTIVQTSHAKRSAHTVFSLDIER
jgi:hypothetical protein